MGQIITKTTSERICRLIEVGLVEYGDAWAWQRELVAQRSAGTCEDTLLLLQHPPTVTLGRATKAGHVLVSTDELARRGVALVETDRGGDATYHAPGQLVGYPILKLSRYGGDLLRYIRALEEVIIRVLTLYGLHGERVAGLTGVWVGDQKIAAIGVRISAGGITSHGFALNVSPDLSGFAQIIPCGISDRGVTSLEKLLGNAPSLPGVAAQVAEAFGAVFECTLKNDRDMLHYSKEQNS